MKYYQTEYVFKRSITGTELQTEPIPQYYKRPYYFTEIKWSEFPEFEPVVKLRLEEKSKFTDIVRLGNYKGNGFLVSPRVKELWEQFNIFSCKYHPGTIINYCEDEEREYYLFQMAAHDLEGIDYSKSIFENQYKEIGEDETGWPICEKVKINSIKDRITQEAMLLYLNKLYFTVNFPKYDLFYVPYFMVSPEFFISEKLVEAMKKEKITGLAYHEQNIIDEF